MDRCRVCNLISENRSSYANTLIPVINFRSRAATNSKGKASKRKADELDTSTTDTLEELDPQAKKAKTDDVASTPDLPAPTSRSGRLIKPKKFVDDDLTPSKTVTNIHCLSVNTPGQGIYMLTTNFNL